MAKQHETQEALNTVEQTSFVEESNNTANMSVKASPENIETRDEIDGYVTTDKAARMISEAINSDVTTSKVNYLAYRTQLKAIRIGTTMLIEKKSIVELIPQMINKVGEKEKRAKEKEEQAKKAQLLKKLKQNPELLEKLLNSNEL